MKSDALLDQAEMEYGPKVAWQEKWVEDSMFVPFQPYEREDLYLESDDDGFLQPGDVVDINPLFKAAYNALCISNRWAVPAAYGEARDGHIHVVDVVPHQYHKNELSVQINPPGSYAIQAADGSPTGFSDIHKFGFPAGAPLFVEVVEVGKPVVFHGSPPRNNDGRVTCWWCEVPTAKRGGGMYDVCPKCGR